LTPYLHAFFDAAYYLRQLGGEHPADAWAHFVAQGDGQGLDPSPYFSTRFYKAVHPHWQADGAPTALHDFLACEQACDWRQPHPLIDPWHYLARYPDLVAANAQPSLHFALHGDAEGRSPSSGFDADFYGRCYLALGQKMAFRHFAEARLAEASAAGAVPRHLPVPVARGFDESTQAARAATSALARPVLLCAHDAQAAGVPILLRDIAQALRGHGFTPCFVLLNGGPLRDDFSALGPVFLLAEGWHLPGLLAGMPPQAAMLVNTAAAVDVALAAARQRRRTLLLVHEMRGYLQQQGLLAPLQAAQRLGVQLVASFPRMVDELAPELGALPRLQPGIVLPRLRYGAFAAVHRRLRGRPVFIGAGHADLRKGFDLFLAACRAIHRQQADAAFVWLGQLDPWAQALASQAQQDGLPLELPGFVADSLAWYREAAVYLLTSREDAGPATAIHAAAVGTGFVGLAHRIGLRGVADPALGRFVPADDLDGLVDEALRLARQDGPAQRRGRRRWVRQNVSFDAYVAALIGLLTPAAT
jgi:hypothetical protein